MATYSIITGSGFTGNAQYVTGSIYEGISLGTLTSGSKYDISFDYISSAPLNVYSSDYSDKFIVTQYPSTIAINSGSIKSWSGEFLAVYDKENFLGLGSDGWFAVDKLRVKPIPNLVTNGTFDSGTGWSVGTGWTISGGVATCDGTNFVACLTTYSLAQIGKKYRISLEIKNYVSGALTVQMGGTGADVGNWTSNGIKNIDYTPTTTGIFLLYSRNFSGSVDNIHIYEIPEWTSTGNHTCNVSTLDKSSGTQSLKVTASGAGSSGSNYVSLPSANLESCVSGKKYTLEGEGRLDPASLTYGSDLFTSISHSATHPYETFTASGNDITSAINTTGAASAYVNIGNVTANEIVKVTFNLTLNSGTAPRVLLMQSGEAISGTNSDVFTPVSGANTLYMRVIGSQSPTYLVIREPSTTATNFSISDIVVTKSNALAPTVTLQLGTKLVTSPALSIVAGTFTKFVLNFEATSGEVNQDLKLWLSGAGNVYMDKLSLTQAYDMWINTKTKFTDDIFALWAKCLNLGNNSGNGIGIWAQPGYLYFDVYAGSPLAGVERNIVRSTIPDNAWYEIGFKIDHSSNIEYGKVGSLTSYNISSLGKIIENTMPFTIGANSTSYWLLNGQISHLQIIRFENISQSTFNSSLTGLQYPTGGGAEEVLRLTWNNIAGTTAYNESTYGALASTNAVGFGTKNAATNIVTVKDYLYQKDKLIQPTEVNRPVYTSGSYFQFDGTNDFLYHTGSLGVIKEFYIKFKPDVVNTNMGIVNFNATSSLFLSSSNIAFMSGSTFSTMSIYNSSLIPTSSVTNSNWNILHCSDSTGTLANLFKIGVAGTTYYDGAVQRYLSYDRQLSDNDRIRILRNLSF